MTNELQEGPFEAPHSHQAQPALAPVKVSWREKRLHRRRRRVWLEEVLGWILVPLILFACYWAFEQVLGTMGMTPASLMDGINAIIAHL